MSSGTRLTISQRMDMKDYIDLGMSAKEISEATHASVSSVYKYKSVYARKLAREAKAINKAMARKKEEKPTKEGLITSVSIDHDDFLRVVELCERFNVPRHIGMRCLLHPEEMKSQESKLGLEHRVKFLEKRLAEEEARNIVLLEKLK